MKNVVMYKNELSGEVFADKEKAEKNEKDSIFIRDTFVFWDKYDHKNSDDFCQRTAGDYEKLQDAIIVAVKEVEPYINSQYDKDGGLKREHVHPGYMLGRYLSDANSKIWTYLCTLGRICDKCYKEWDQPYYANNCACE
jgi:hypothetical protein